MCRCLNLFLFVCLSQLVAAQSSVIRFNQLGYPPRGIKVAVFGSKTMAAVTSFQLIDATSNKTVFEKKTGRAFGKYGPFETTYRLDFSDFQKPGTYFLRCADVVTTAFLIGDDVYNGAADFCLRYMRQQRSGFNPFLKDSCHTHDGYTLYGPMPDSTHIDVTGGWHDASDYLQYSTTSANATYHLLMAARDFPQVFSDIKLANGLDGRNGLADVLDEAKWGLDWLLKMHPKDDWLFNQLGDDRDHMGMRIPKEDSFYGRGFERPVYFCSGKPQQRGKLMNNSTGVASTAGKFSSAFALGSQIFTGIDKKYSSELFVKSLSAMEMGLRNPGVCQTASVRSPYIYAEDNWTDDMELASAAVTNMIGHANAAKYLNAGGQYAKMEPVTPWLGADTAKHYQWYPFVNIGHYEMAKLIKLKPTENPYLDFYQQGIEKVWTKAKTNAFYRGIPFIWCSNNLTTCFATQCYWYRTLSIDNQYQQLEQANFDWLFGCNPWGTSMVYGLPANGDTPEDPHSAFTHLKKYPIDGGLVDGPVYTSIYKGLIGISLQNADEYADWQSDLAVYHDDYGDYSTNEPTMDGTASLIYLLAAKEAEAAPGKRAISGKGSLAANKIKADKKTTTQMAASPNAGTISNKSEGDPAISEPPLANIYLKGANIRGDTSQRRIALVFTGHEFGEGGKAIITALKTEKIKASFFFTGDFYRNRAFAKTIRTLKSQGHYLGAHSDKHLLYADWEKRDSLLVTKDSFTNDIKNNFVAMKPFGLSRKSSPWFLPPYEWYNDSITAWAETAGLKLINYTPGTLSNADYTTPSMPNYRASDTIYQSVLRKATEAPTGMNGYILLFHLGTDKERIDKMYQSLPLLLQELVAYGYKFVRIDGLLK
ncbi:MAG: glycoside hydrolase family 9 protein [Chitinophagaceae bacterium]